MSKLREQLGSAFKIPRDEYFPKPAPIVLTPETLWSSMGYGDLLTTVGRVDLTHFLRKMKFGDLLVGLLCFESVISIYGARAGAGA